MSSASKPVSNEEILDLLHVSMQMTSDGFVRIEGRIDNLEARMNKQEAETKEIKTILYEHSKRLSNIETTVERIESEQRAQTNDIREILDRLVELEAKTEMNKAEQREFAHKLQRLVDWAKLTAEQLNIPLKI